MRRHIQILVMFDDTGAWLCHPITKNHLRRNIVGECKDQFKGERVKDIVIDVVLEMPDEIGNVITKRREDFN